MNFKNVQKNSLALAACLGLVLQTSTVFAQPVPNELFPSTPGNNVVTNPIPLPGNMGGGSTPKPMPNGNGQNNGNNQNNGNGNGNGNNNGNGKTPTNGTPIGIASNGKLTMKPADVNADYKCPIFENRPHAELIAAIDLMIKEVNSSPECTGAPSARNLEENGKTIQTSMANIKETVLTQDPSTINMNQVEQTLTTALGAISNIGSIINNNEFLNSKCGRQTMSTGKILLALNDIINGISPYALLAVSMNPAFAPAMPLVVGGAVTSAGISAIAKMIDQNTLDMSLPEHRRAVLQNTCQYTKIAAKVRFLQLAQSGKIKTITQELEKKINFYRADFSQPSKELTSLLNYREMKTKFNSAIEKQYTKDMSDLLALENQVSKESDDLMVCTLTKEFALAAKDGGYFPTSAFNNLELAVSQSDRAAKLQAAGLKSLNATSIEKILDSAAHAFENDYTLKTCAKTGRSWIFGTRNALQLTYEAITKARDSLEYELSTNPEYNKWKAQYSKLRADQFIISRVEKTMEELSKDSSVIDRSELDQRMRILKAGLFGSSTAWSFGKPPVMAWIDHTKSMHDQAVASMSSTLDLLQRGAYSLTAAGRGQAVDMGIDGIARINTKKLDDSSIAAKNLVTLNTTNLPVGSNQHQITCQNLESVWLDWSASLDHLGSIQLFCQMIDPVLDTKMDSDILEACRGVSNLNGKVLQSSIVEGAVQKLIKKGFQANAALVSQKMEDLQCPLPPVSVMGQ